MPAAYTLSAHAHSMLLARGITAAWVERCLAEPERQEPDPVDADLRHAMRKIPENDGRVLRVVFDARGDVPHVVTAFFDRRLRGAW
ncbi:MAG: DUF4258 domain-containing protein [Phycisphaerae bacterium]